MSKEIELEGDGFPDKVELADEIEKYLKGLGDDPLELMKHGANSKEIEVTREEGPDDGDMLG